MNGRDLSVPKLVCQRCSTVLRSHHDTNGGGGVIELVEPCPECMRTRKRAEAVRHFPALVTAVPAMNGTYKRQPMRAMPKPRIDASGGYHCCICDAALEYKGWGRPPAYCAEHKP